MHFDDESLENATEIGSDDLLSDDQLRLPENANPLVRLHAVRAWLARRKRETNIEIGKVALSLQQLQQEDIQNTHLRRREREELAVRTQHTQQAFQDAQLRLETYEEAEHLLEDCVNHTTVGERLLVEYYLTLENLIQDELQENEDVPTPRVKTFIDVQRRIEHVGAPNEDE